MTNEQIIQDLRTQLAEYKAIEQRVLEFGRKLDFKRGETINVDKVIYQAEKQLADAQKQLAAERAMADRLAETVNSIVGRAVLTPTNATIKLGIDEYMGVALRFTAYEKHQATRQPTQDKGATDEQA